MFYNTKPAETGGVLETLIRDHLRSPYERAKAADAAWTAAYQAICPKGTWPGDFRYTDAATGEPGSDLRSLYNEFRAATEAWNEEARKPQNCGFDGPTAAE